MKNENKKFITKDSGARSDYASGMSRDLDTDKPRYDLIYIPMLKRLAELHGRGIKKYGERNWENANSIEEYLRFKASAFRHLIQWMEYDIEEDHASAILFNVNAAEMIMDNNNFTQEQIDKYMKEKSMKAIK